MDKKKNVKLSRYTTFKVGGAAKYFSEVTSESELKDIIHFAKEQDLPLFIIGEGSDILVSDKNFNSVVIKLINKKIELSGDQIVSGAGVIWDDLVKFSVENNLQGIECLSGIPGTVGAAPVQNIGAYGQELKDTLLKVKVYDTEKEEFIFLENGDCAFSYRESVFKNKKFKKYIIFEVVLKLNKNGLPKVSYESLRKYLEENRIKSVDLLEVRNAVLKIRSQKLEDPKKIPNAGSFFKNPIINKAKFDIILDQYPDIPNFPNGKNVKLFAGWLIEKCGWKGKNIGEAGVSGQNALVLVNLGKATAKEIKELSENIINDVNSKFGIKLEPEVQFINF